MDKEERAKARATWPGKKMSMAQDVGSELWNHATAAERVEAVWQLTLTAWAMAGRAIPDYVRSEMPGVVRRAKARQ